VNAAALFAAFTSAPRLDGALCRGRAAEFDEPPPGVDPAAADAAVTAAVTVCGACPALAACAAWVDGLPPPQRPTGVVAGRLYRHGGRGRPDAGAVAS
jgi:hypothetical protein